MKFDMNTVWSRGIELMSDNFQLLLVIAAVFMMLPNIALYLLLPDMQNMQAFGDPSAPPEVVLAQLGEVFAPILGAIGLLSLFGFAGQGAMIALMGDHRPTVGEALGTGIKIIPSLIAVTFIFAFLYAVAAFVLIAPFALIASAVDAPALVFLAALLVFAFVLWLMARMSLAMPVLVLGGTLNPITAVIQSFRLTGPSQWAILLFWAMIYVIYFIIAIIFTGIVGVVAALIGTGITSALILGLANGAVAVASAMVICALATAMFAQLTGPSAGAMAETFE